MLNDPSVLFQNKLFSKVWCGVMDRGLRSAYSLISTFQYLFGAQALHTEAAPFVLKWPVHIPDNSYP